MSDMTKVIVAKSDQLNTDDLIGGSQTIHITKVAIAQGGEQPVSVHYEGDQGKPYKPGKSMCRVMVAAWGNDAKAYAGRSMTVYRDEKVKWAGMEVGGIRISHMSHINEPMTIALTATRGSKKLFTVKPLVILTEEEKKIATDEASKGIEHLESWWKALTAADKKKYHPIKDELKTIAEGVNHG